MAEFADNEFVADKVVVVGDMAFEIAACKIGKVSDDYVRILYGRLDEGHGFHIGNRVDYIGIGVF